MRIRFFLLFVLLLGPAAAAASEPSPGIYWGVVPGRIDRYDYFPPRAQDPGGLIAYYSYSLGGTHYSSHTFIPVRYPGDADGLLRGRPRGSAVEVHYDSRDPKRSFVMDERGD